METDGTGTAIQNQLPMPIGFPRTAENYAACLTERKRIVELQMRRMFLSCGRPVPDDETLEIRVGDALLLWDGIPSEKISLVVSEALTEAGGYIPGNGRIAKIYRDAKSGERKIPGLFPVPELNSLRIEDSPPADPVFVSGLVHEVLEKLKGIP